MPPFCTTVEDFWRSWRQQRRQFVRLSNWYEAGKTRLRALVRDFSLKLARERNERILQLNRTLADLEKRADSGTTPSASLVTTRAELDELLLHRAQGARLRARIQDAEVRSQRKLIGAMRRKDGSIATSPGDVLTV